ncbi:f-box domain-containing protein [Trichonephila clavipes]|nr:f-box domain-containing protein [Trichonephila clavipes]
MDFDRTIMELPDEVLYKICTFINCPFDLLHFGNTCSRLRKISSSSSVWWSIAFHWFKGLWVFMEDGSGEENARNWFLDILRLFCKRPIRTKLECVFSNGEMWRRVDNPRFRILVNMMRMAYSTEKEEHPAVLYEEWLYDIGLYKRFEPNIDFKEPTLEFNEDMVNQLCTLGQASERDLCRRKQPFKSLKYYIKRIETAEKSYMTNLFANSPCGSICPLLISPFVNALAAETSGVQGLSMCSSIVFEKHLQKYYKACTLSLPRVWEIVKVFCTIFVTEILDLLLTLSLNMSVRLGVIKIVDENLCDFKQSQFMLDHFDLNIESKHVAHDLAIFLRKYQGIDFAVDEIRSVFRNAINEEIHKVLFPPGPSNYFVTRINLTDSDLIGGDNFRQEMAAAAFVSRNGVLVTWHLIGRMRY